MLRAFGVAIASLLLASPFAGRPAQANKTFPSDDEVLLVMNQTERALSDYEASVAVRRSWVERMVTFLMTSG